MSYELETTSAFDLIVTGKIWPVPGANPVGSENIYFTNRFGSEYYCKCYPQRLADLNPTTPQKQSLYKTGYIPKTGNYCAILDCFSSELGYFYNVRLDTWPKDKFCTVHTSEIERLAL